MRIVDRNITVRDSVINAKQVKQTAEKVQKSEPKQLPQSTTKSAAKSKNTSGSSAKSSTKKN